MTIRELFERKKRSDTGFALCGFLIMLIALIACALSAGFLNVRPVYAGLFFAVLYIAFILISIVYERLFAFHCPRCEKKIDHLIARDQNISYCPFCSVDLDVEIDRKSQRLTEFLDKEWGQRGREIENTHIKLPPGKQKENVDIRLPPRNEETGTA